MITRHYFAAYTGYKDDKPCKWGYATFSRRSWLSDQQAAFEEHLKRVEDALGPEYKVAITAFNRI